MPGEHQSLGSLRDARLEIDRPDAVVKRWQELHQAQPKQPSPDHDEASYCIDSLTEATVRIIYSR